MKAPAKRFHYEERNFLPLVVKKAKEAWLRLPPQTRIWVSLDDFIQDGLMFLRFNVLPKYNPKRTTFLTLAWISLTNHFKFVTYHYYMQKRFDGRNAPLQEISLSCSLRPKHPAELQAVDLIEKIYCASSPHLKMYMARWLHPAYKGTFNLRGHKFDAAVEEFQTLMQTYKIDLDGMHYLMSNQQWLNHSPITKDLFRHLG